MGIRQSMRPLPTTRCFSNAGISASRSLRLHPLRSSTDPGRSFLGRRDFFDRCSTGEGPRWPRDRRDDPWPAAAACKAISAGTEKIRTSYVPERREARSKSGSGVNRPSRSPARTRRIVAEILLDLRLDGAPCAESVTVFHPSHRRPPEPTRLPTVPANPAPHGPETALAVRSAPDRRDTAPDSAGTRCWPIARSA